VFTRTPLQGNQVAVFRDGAGLDAQTMQRTARELNLSETVFLGPGDDEHDASVRIFTPTNELPFAGHPVLGSAFVVGERMAARATEGGGESPRRARVRLRTGAGTVPIALTRDGAEIVFGEMDQPLPSSATVPPEAPLLAALGLSGSTHPIAAYVNGPTHVYIGAPDIDALQALTPDLRALTALGSFGVLCFAVGRSHVEARYFVPALGVAEDPATGSAAGPLALHLARCGVVSYGQSVEIHQGTAMGRPSVLHARAEAQVHDGAERLERVVVGGGAVRVAEGRYRLG
jgi:trans-2,3-dihydro-3-hydroxyanthranilate isomerase